MKHTLVRSILTPALALALPCLAFAQAGSSSPTPSSKPHDRSISPPGHSASDASAGSPQRITKDHLDSQLTAKTLIGKDVHGSDGKKLGEVIDIVLAPSLAVGKTDTRTGTTASGSSSAAQGSTYPETGVAGPRPSGSLAADGRSAMGAIQGMQPAVVVSTGGLLGMGNDLLRVPMAKIAYDADKKEVRLNVTDDEWKALREARPIGGVTSSTR